ncbi:hypothetical protein BKA70DRAFT_1238885 [Coprinopsis sp. MPI-PUGE-AT-0042]|nr:hypothetical protein BKA70DRAFT_1238885 [Coprinopsis sp. MPI-PUGE-AT-0042]
MLDALLEDDALRLALHLLQHATSPLGNPIQSLQDAYGGDLLPVITKALAGCTSDQKVALERLLCRLGAYSCHPQVLRMFQRSLSTIPLDLVHKIPQRPLVGRLHAKENGWTTRPNIRVPLEMEIAWNTRNGIALLVEMIKMNAGEWEPRSSVIRLEKIGESHIPLGHWGSNRTDGRSKQGSGVKEGNQGPNKVRSNLTGDRENGSHDLVAVRLNDAKSSARFEGWESEQRLQSNSWDVNHSGWWEMARVVDIAWSFRSISTGRYLGMAAGDQVANHHKLREVEHPFPWHLRKDDPGLMVSIIVPYTDYVIDLSDGNDPPKPGAVLKIYQDHRVPHQQWYLCQDLHLATSRALKHGTEYKIVNTQSNTAIEINDAKDAKWMAFRHAETQDYLGLRNSVVPFPDGERLSSVKKEFTWAVLPHHDDTSKFKIWIPFTSRVVDLHGGWAQDDTPIHLFPERDVDSTGSGIKRFRRGDLYDFARSAFEDGDGGKGWKRQVLLTLLELQRILREMEAVVNWFMGSKLQQWEIAKVVGQLYSIRNVGTQRYLGMRVNERVRNGYKLVDVEEAFPWEIRPTEYVGRVPPLMLCVPYTDYVTVLDHKEDSGLQAGSCVLLHQLQPGFQQLWRLSKAVYFCVDNDSDLQQFIAVETEQGWAFQNVARSVPDGTQVASVEKAFTWIVLPSPVETSEFKLWVPFTPHVIDALDEKPKSNTPVQLGKQRVRACQWWKFEPGKWCSFNEFLILTL